MDLRPRRRPASPAAGDGGRGDGRGPPRDRRHHRRGRLRPRRRRQRHHPHRSPRRPAGPPGARRPGGRGRGQRRRHDGRPRNRQAPRRPGARRRLRQLLRSVRRSRELPARTDRPRRAADAADLVRGLQAGERGDRGGVLARERVAVDRPETLRRLRPRQGPGLDLDADQGDARRGARPRLPHHLRGHPRLPPRRGRRRGDDPGGAHPARRGAGLQPRGQHRPHGRYRRRHRGGGARCQGQDQLRSCCPAHPSEVDDSQLSADIPGIRWRSLGDGVRDSVELFRRAVAAGRIDVERALAQ